MDLLRRPPEKFPPVSPTCLAKQLSNKTSSDEKKNELNMIKAHPVCICNVFFSPSWVLIFFNVLYAIGLPLMGVKPNILFQQIILQYYTNYQLLEIK